MHAGELIVAAFQPGEVGKRIGEMTPRKETENSFYCPCRYFWRREVKAPWGCYQNGVGGSKSIVLTNAAFKHCKTFKFRIQNKLFRGVPFQVLTKERRNWIKANLARNLENPKPKIQHGYRTQLNPCRLQHWITWLLCRIKDYLILSHILTLISNPFVVSH